jgi:cyclophilin family peptidyl-prolyl cis-trans isomerase
MFRTLLAIGFCLSGASLVIADPPEPPAGSKSAEFAGLLKERSDVIKESSLKIKKIQEEYEKKTKDIEAKVFAAAEGAYAEAPNADPRVVEALLACIADHMRRDDYEPAFRLGKMLMDNKCPVPEASALAGVAAYCVNEYDLAALWLKPAEESRARAIKLALGKLERWELPNRRYATFPDLIDATKAGWLNEKKFREAEAKANDLPRVLLKTSAGDIELELFENEAPNTVLNFITLVDKGFYNGLKFHRVLPGFMAQGGDPKGDGSGGPGYTIPGEFHRPDHRLHFRGSLSMARSAEPDSGGSQFFLTFLPVSHLNGNYTVFGRIVKGTDVLAKFKRRDPDNSEPGTVDRIIEAKVTRRRPHPYEAKDLKKSSN